MNDRDVILWQDSRTPSLARNDSGEVCYLDNLAPNYGKPMYVCLSGRKLALMPDFLAACAWFDWAKES